MLATWCLRWMLRWGNLTGFENLVVSVLLSFFTPARGQVLMVNSAVFVFENSKNYDLAWNQIALL